MISCQLVPFGNHWKPFLQLEGWVRIAQFLAHLVNYKCSEISEEVLGVIDKMWIYIISKFLGLNFLSKQTLSAPWALMWLTGTVWSVVAVWATALAAVASHVGCIHTVSLSTWASVGKFFIWFSKTWANWAFYQELGYVVETVHLGTIFTSNSGYLRKSITILTWVFWICLLIR